MCLQYINVKANKVRKIVNNAFGKHAYSSGVHATLVFKNGKTVTTISESQVSTLICICVKLQIMQPADTGV
jgi:hypothetical protein